MSFEFWGTFSWIFFHGIQRLFFLESNRRPTNRRLSQGVKGKNQKQRETSRIAELEVVSSSESEDIPENQNEPVLNGKITN